MATINPPVPLPLRRAQWRRVRAQQLNRGWTGKTQIVRLPEATRWTVSGEFRTIITEENALAWQAFFEELDGMANVFPLRATETRQTTATNPTVNGASQTGSQLSLTGLSGSVGSTFLAKGRKISIVLPSGDVQLETLTQPLIVAAGGTGIAYFKGTLRQSPANGAAVEVQWPYALIRSTTGELGYDVEAGQTYAFAFTGEEAF
jgi:hypothetical protein